MDPNKPRHIDLKRDAGLTITWADATTSFYPIEHLRKLSPSAEMKVMREQMESNPLHVLPDKYARHSADSSGLTALDAELVGNYAIRIRFSDGHDTGIYTWDYLRQIDPTPSPSEGEGRGED